MSSFRAQFPNTSIYSYCPHQLWTYVPSREKSVAEYTRDHEHANIYHYFTLGGNTNLDKKYRKKFTGSYYKVELLVINSIKRNLHVSALGDIVVSSKIEKILSEKVDAIYASSDTESKKEINLIELFSQKNSCSIIIENNRQKAEKIRRQISSPFYIPK